MRYMKSIRLFLFIALIMFACFADATAETCNRVVAIVNDDVITLFELNKRIMEITGLAPVDLRKKSEDRFLETRRRVLDLLVDEKISQGKIKELGIQVTSKQVDEAVERIKKTNQWTHEDLLYRLETQGLSYEQYADKIKENLERTRLINFEVKSKIIIREEMVEQYYEEHLSEFSSEGSVHLASIFLVGRNPEDEKERNELAEKGKNILDELRGGKDFGEFAREFSSGPMAGAGGDLGSFKISQLEPEIREILQGLQVGGISKLIERPNGFQIIKLIDRKGGKRKPLSELREAIYDILYQMEVNKTYASWIRKLRDNSYTRIVF